MKFVTEETKLTEDFDNHYVNIAEKNSDLKSTVLRDKGLSEMWQKYVILLTHSMLRSLSIPPENIRKPVASGSGRKRPVA